MISLLPKTDLVTFFKLTKPKFWEHQFFSSIVTFEWIFDIPCLNNLICCKAKVTNFNKHKHLQNNTTRVNSVGKIHGNYNQLNESFKDYNPHENENKDIQYRCYCEFNTYRGLMTHRQSCFVLEVTDFNISLKILWERT